MTAISTVRPLRRDVCCFLGSGLALALCTTTAHADDPVGPYDVTGYLINLTYEGTVQVERDGETFRVKWTISDVTWEGIGIRDTASLAVAYRSGDTVGLAVYSASGAGWEGKFAALGDQQLRAEKWKRRR